MHFPDKISRQRDGSPAVPIHPYEIALLGVTAAHLCFLPWALGSMHRWSQLCSLVLSITGIALALLPRERAFEELNVNPQVKNRMAVLLRTPIFWAGLALLSYIVVQGLNPAWRYASNDSSWWLEPVVHIKWLPAGMEVPFQQAGPWRALIIYASLWLLVCSVWIGFRRRKSFRLLLLVLAINACLLALLGIFQQLTDSTQIFWSYKPGSTSFLSSFIYRNHAGSYFNLMLATATCLAFWYQQRAERQLRQSSPAGVFAFVAVVVGIALIFSRSRGSIIGLAAFTGVFTGILAWRHFRRPKAMRTGGGRFVLVMLFTAFIGTCFMSVRVEQFWHRFSAMAVNSTAEIQLRSVVRQASSEMLADRWLLGWGAGCFRYGFPIYTQKYPVLCYNGGQTLYWEHAHDDLLEFPVELGVAGMLPIMVMFGCAALELARRRFWRNTLALLLVLACLLTLAHAWVDFVFQNPAVLLTWGVLLVTAVRWAEFDRAGAKASTLSSKPSNSHTV